MAKRAPAFRPLLSYEVNSTSDALRRGAALRFRRECDVSLMEWRTLALIGHLQPVTLRALTDYSMTDKAQISRIVTGLVGRRMVDRTAHSTDARSAEIALSALGELTLAALTRAARARDKVIRAALTEEEARMLSGLLARVKVAAVALCEQEEQISNDAGDAQAAA